ncbi:MAG TPA: cytochrome c biogenesis protein CcdA [Candidatus Paceibacterota bacterium]|nr:cytochrome c biogenesis protein CcdA [Candidatus Paceibacterota bacterium]
MIDIDLVSAFVAGLLTFFAPCTYPLIPGYLGFIGGESVLGNTKKEGLRKRMMLNASIFLASFSLIFILLGAVSGAIGGTLFLYKDVLARVGGGLIVIFGLSLLGAVPWLKFPSWTVRLPAWARPGTLSGSALLGLILASAWTPCLGPVIGSIFILAGASGTVFSGIVLFGLYALGFSLPFLLLAYFFGSAMHTTQALSRYVPIFAFASGALLVITGILLALGKFGALTSFVASLVEGGAWMDMIMNRL